MIPGLPTTPLAKSKKPLLLIVALLFAFAAGIALWSFVFHRSQQKTERRTATNTGALGQTVTGGVRPRAATPLPTNLPVDTDHDGLTDQEETDTYHTDPKNADTDHDGLSDKSEVKVYHADPLKPDTDGDGTSDGEEVRRGQNPNGGGALLDTAAAIQQLQNVSR